MAREKETFREVVAILQEHFGTRLLTASDVRKYLHCRHATAQEYMEGKKTITAFQLARKLC